MFITNGSNDNPSTQAPNSGRYLERICHVMYNLLTFSKCDKLIRSFPVTMTCLFGVEVGNIMELNNTSALQSN